MKRWTWYGSMIGDADTTGLSPRVLAEITAVHDAACAEDWTAALAARPHERLNTWRPGSTTCATPLHRAAAGGADVEVVASLVARGAWRTLRTLGGRRAFDIARAARAGEQLLAVLEPAPIRTVPDETLALWQHHLDALLRTEGQPASWRHELRLPPVSVLTELPEGDTLWFPVPGMTGGFRLQLTDDGVVVSSDSRVVEDASGRYLVTTSGVQALPYDVDTY